MTNRIDTAKERDGLNEMRKGSWDHSAFHELLKMAGQYLNALDAKDTESAAALDEIDRLRDILRTIVSRAQSAKHDCESGAPISAYNLASGILGQIGADVAALSGEDET